MATVQHSCVEHIGDTAGVVWNYLHDHGPCTVTQLTKEIDAPRDTLMQALGWFAHEDKISIDEEGRGKKIISLRA